MKKKLVFQTRLKKIIYSIVYLSLIYPLNIKGQINYLDAVNSNHQNSIQMITSPDNKFAYVIAYNEIQTYQRNVNNGQLTFLSSLSQMSPSIQLYNIRNIAISPDAKFIYTQGVHNTFVFIRDTLTGIITPHQTLTNGSSSSYYPFTNNNIVVSNNGEYIYTAGGKNLFIYKRNFITGNLSMVNTIQNLNDIPFTTFDISILLSSDNRLAFITGGNSISTYLIDTLTGNLIFKNIISGNNFVNQGLTYANESVKSADDKFLYTVTGSMGSGALNVLKRDTLTDSLSITQTIYVYNPRFINICNAKKLICVTGDDLTFYQIDSISGQLNYFSSFHDSISSKYYGKKHLDSNCKYLYACPYTDSVYIFQLDFTLSVPSIIGDKDKISIYPNPFSYQVTLQTTTLLDNATINIDNYFGRTVKQINNISGHTITFNRNNLPSGLYLIRLTQGNKTIFSNKLIIVD